MTAPVRLICALAAAVAIAATLAACGSGVPPNSVAKVGDEVVSKEEFDRWFETALLSSQDPTADPEDVVVPDPPDYAECVAALRKQLPKKGEAPTDEELKQQCEQQYELVKSQVMQFLIQSAAITQEAEQRGVTVSDEEVRTQFDELKDQAFKNDAEYQEFLETSGRSEEDLLYQTRLDLLSTRLREDVIGDLPAPTEEAIQNYYEENGDQPPIGQPETRDIEIVLTETEQEASDAKARLEDGEKWADVAKDVSSVEAADSGGVLEDVAEGQQEEALDNAVFSAEKDAIVGPIETQFGWYVFRVTDITPAERPPLEEVEEQIVEQLRQQREQEALSSFVEDFQRRSTDATSCAKGYEVQGCKNAPKAETVTTPGGPVPEGVPPGAPPTGAPPTGAPPGGPPPAGPPPPQGQQPPAGPPPAGPPPQGGGGG